MATQLPQPFGKYILLNKIAMGGMAEIFRAKTIGAEGFEKEVVIKRILPHFTEDEAFVTMFIDEAKVSSGLNHPNIVQIYDFDRLDETYYIAMEYIEGKDLKRLMDVGVKSGAPLSVPRVVSITMEVCKGLHYAHTKKHRGQALNIIHRDVSPHNVMVSYDGEVKVMDFGIAKAAQRSTKTRAGTVKGKCAYMSPEQARGKNLDPRSDMFAVGVMMWEMLTHRRLFAGDSDFETLSNVLKAEAPPPSSINPEVPPELDAIILKCLAKERDERQADCKALMRELESWFYSSVGDPETAELAPFMRKMFADDIAALREMQREDAKTQFVEASEVVRAQRGSSASHQAVRHSSASMPAVSTNNAATVALDVSQAPGLNAERTVAVDPSATGLQPGEGPKKSRAGLWAALAVLVLAGGGFAAWWFGFRDAPAPAAAIAKADTPAATDGAESTDGVEAGRATAEDTGGVVAAEGTGQGGGTEAESTGGAAANADTGGAEGTETEGNEAAEPQKARVTFSAIPDDAEITVRGKTAAGKLEIEANVGDVLAVIVKHPDYEQVIKSVKVDAPGEKAVDVPMLNRKKPDQPEVQLAQLTFKVKPENAKLLINDQEQPATADGVYQLSGYKVGEDITIEVDAAGHVKETDSLRITVPELSREYTLRRRPTTPTGPGKARFTAKPWANVSVKGKTCTTTCVLDLPSGVHRAVFSQGGKTKTKRVRVSPNKTSSVFVDMTR